MYEFNLAPKSLSEQSADFKKQYPTLDDLPSSDYLMMPKYDGCMAIVDIENQQIISRTGELVRSMPHVLEELTKWFPNTAVVFGEAWTCGVPFKVTSGRFRRHSPQTELSFAAFDVVARDEWDAGVCNVPYMARLDALTKLKLLYPMNHVVVPLVADLVNPQVYADSLKKIGWYDGAMIRKKSGTWFTGPSKNGEAIRVKPVFSLDLVAEDWFVGKGKFQGMAGGITVTYNGVTTKVGTGFDNAERVDLRQNGTRKRIAEIECMEITAAGKLREPRFKGWRDDKTGADE